MGGLVRKGGVLEGGVSPWGGEGRTRSASESSSWPMRLDFLRQRATLPSMKSKKRPKGMKARAAQRLDRSSAGPRQ